jgi:hypothetical protein
MKTIDSATLRAFLKAEKKRLRELRARDFDDNRARFSAASEDAVSRVLVLEELLDGAVLLAEKREPGGTSPGNDSLDL